MSIDVIAPAGEPLAVDLLNTVHVADGQIVDSFATDEEVADWLWAREAQVSALLGAPVRRAPLLAAAPRMRKLRDAARQLASAVVSDPREAVTPETEHADAVAILNGMAASWVQLDWPATGSPVAVLGADGDAAELVVNAFGREVVSLLTSAEQRLRPCLAPSCEYLSLLHEPLT